MAAYKKDINLFKAAGGERAKSKKMPATKKMLLVAVLVVILVAGAIAALYYFNTVYTKQLSVLEKRAEDYKMTQNSTKKSLAEYHDVLSQMDTAVLIEYQSMLNAGFSTNLSNDELKAVRGFLALETTGYTIDNNFDDVVDEVLAGLNLVQYRDESTTYSEDVYNARFLYSGLSYMKSLRTIFEDLPMQSVEDEEEPNYWYCYYRGKLLMLLRSTGGDASALATQLQSASDLGCQPFCSLVPGSTSTLPSSFAMYSSVQLQDTTYTVIAVTCKTLPERFLDCVEDIYNKQTLGNEMRYKIGKVEYETASATLTVEFSMEQTEDFRLKDVCDAVAASPFFISKNDFAYEVSDATGPIDRELKFEVNNDAVNATIEAAESYFVVRETSKEE